jgi:hypothetical protein
MKILVKFCIALLLPASLIAANTDTTIINGVNIVSEYSKAIFPASWQGGAINATGEQIAPDELKRAEPIIIKALKKYPQNLLKITLRSVYLIKSMSFFNVGFGGTNSSDAVYVTNNGETNGYTDAYIEQTFHHEFSSILFRDYPSLIDTITWKKQNDPGFDYNDPENGVGAIKNNESSQGLNTELAKKGMLTQYAMSSLENDINTVAQNLFMPAPDFWEIADNYPKVGMKVKLLIAFYGKLSSLFTEQYFRSFNKTTN